MTATTTTTAPQHSALLFGGAASGAMSGGGELLALIAAHCCLDNNNDDDDDVPGIRALARLAATCRAGAEAARAPLAARRTPGLGHGAAVKLCARLGLPLSSSARGSMVYRHCPQAGGLWGASVHVARRTGRIVVREWMPAGEDSVRTRTVLSHTRKRHVAQLRCQHGLTHMRWKRWGDEAELRDFLVRHTLIGRSLMLMMMTRAPSSSSATRAHYEAAQCTIPPLPPHAAAFWAEHWAAARASLQLLG